MYKSKDFTELRNWTLDKDTNITVHELKNTFEEYILAAGLPLFVMDIKIDDSLPAIQIKSTENSNYMGIYVYCKYNMVGMTLEGKGEQIKAQDLEKLFYKAVGTVAGLYGQYQKSKNIMRRFGAGGTASALGAGAGIAVGAAIGGSVRMVAKGVRALLRDQEAYDREMESYELILGLGDFLIGGFDPSNIISKLRTKAEEGDKNAQYFIGTVYLEGRGIEKDSDQGVRWIALAARNGEKRSKEFLAYEYLYGEREYSTEERKTGLKYLQELADNGDEDAANCVIGIYGFGLVEGISADISKMVEAAEIYADRGNTYAIMALARTYDTLSCNEKVNDSEYKNDTKAAELYHRILMIDECEYKEEASMGLASMYMEGRGVEENPDSSVNYLKTAAQCGNFEAKAILANYMTFGTGTEKDHKGAQKLCEEVIRKGNLREKSIAYYCNYVISDEAKKYKQSMDYARKCLECETFDESKITELKNYLAEKEELISKMTDEERREYLQERKTVFNIIKEKSAGSDDEKFNRKIIAIVLVVLLMLVVIIVGSTYNRDELEINTETQANNSQESLNEAGEPEAMYGYETGVTYMIDSSDSSSPLILRSHPTSNPKPDDKEGIIKYEDAYYDEDFSFNESDGLVGEFGYNACLDQGTLVEVYAIERSGDYVWVLIDDTYEREYWVAAKKYYSGSDEVELFFIQ